MKKKSHYLYLVFVIFSIFTSSAQNVQWIKTNEKELRDIEKLPRKNSPNEFTLFKVNLNSLIDQLILAPVDYSSSVSNVFINFPDANGNISAFEIYNSPMLEPELANKYPNIQNFTGINKKDPTNIIKISITPAFGMHIMGYDGEGTTYYVDTFTTDFNSFIYYKKKNIVNKNTNFTCNIKANDSNHSFENENFENQILSVDNKFRTFRLALACTTQYAAYHVNNAPSNIPQTTEAEKKAIVLSAMNVTVNRINAIYERDLSTRLILVSNNDTIIFINSDDFTDSENADLAGENQVIITNVIGSSNFDLGHVVSIGDGGEAALGSVCNNSFKATAMTGSSNPIGDPFDIDYVAHEIGHQFGANHTFNGTTGSCGGGNRNLPTAVEPGSGTTIMSYAGICGDEINVQQNSDAYFNQISIREIVDFLQSSQNNCATIISSSNPTPVITSTSGNRTIPHSTPFILTTTATDSNNPNSLTYTWEQTNNQSSTQPPVATSSTGPNFRSIAPTSNSSRSFPSTATVLAGTSNSDGVVSTTWEKLPSVARNMSFATTVRDNNATNGGQTTSADIQITFANVGPFVITYPNNITTTTEPNWSVGEQKTITWNVAGTTANGINTSNVNILMSEDNGQTYPFVVGSNVPNNGSYTITVPALTDASSFAHVKIEAVGNIFYTVSKPIEINITAGKKDFEFENLKIYPNPTTDNVSISFNSNTGNEITIEVYDIRGRKLNIYNIENSGLISTEVNLDQYESGIYLFTIKDGANQATKKVIKK
ncbi:reprolysin-like metallopeptidase [Flavobacterium sp. I3-2]|uniref:reprolysin-like metallopeptidase n=1 Tax=Flavobacterium sp. I3-2 TaxID=2748319 RepID=UPI0015AF3A43|nr:zinc-dependent metalloprotease family protein [Flavobacterium sp. I3-2]